MPPNDRPVLAPVAPTADAAVEEAQRLVVGVPEPTPVPEPQPEPGEPEPPVEEAEVQPEDEAEEQPELTLPEGWDQHETAVEALKTKYNEGYNKAKSTLDRAHNAQVTELEDTHNEELRGAAQRATASAIVQQFSETLGGLDTDDPDTMKAATKLLHTNESWARIYLGNQVRDAYGQLVNLATSNDRWVDQISGEAADEFNATVKELSLKLRSRIARAESNDDVAKAYAGALNSYLEERDKLRDPQLVAAAIAKEQKRLEAAARKAAGLTDKANQRSNNAPPAKPTGAAGAGGTRYASLDEARVLHADGQISNDEMRRAKVRFAAR